MIYMLSALLSVLATMELHPRWSLPYNQMVQISSATSIFIDVAVHSPFCTKFDLVRRLLLLTLTILLHVKPTFPFAPYVIGAVADLLELMECLSCFAWLVIYYYRFFETETEKHLLERDLSRAQKEFSMEFGESFIRIEPNHPTIIAGTQRDVPSQPSVQEARILYPLTVTAPSNTTDDFLPPVHESHILPQVNDMETQHVVTNPVISIIVTNPSGSASLPQPFVSQLTRHAFSQPRSYAEVTEHFDSFEVRTISTRWYHHSHALVQAERYRQQERLRSHFRAQNEARTTNTSEAQPQPDPVPAWSFDGERHRAVMQLSDRIEHSMTMCARAARQQEAANTITECASAVPDGNNEDAVVSPANGTAAATDSLSAVAAFDPLAQPEVRHDNTEPAGEDTVPDSDFDDLLAKMPPDETATAGVSFASPASPPLSSVPHSPDPDTLMTTAGQSVFVASVDPPSPTITATRVMQQQQSSQSVPPMPSPVNEHQFATGTTAPPPIAAQPIPPVPPQDVDVQQVTNGPVLSWLTQPVPHAINDQSVTTAVTAQTTAQPIQPPLPHDAGVQPLANEPEPLLPTLPHIARSRRRVQRSPCQVPPVAYTTRSGRQVRPPARFMFEANTTVRAVYTTRSGRL